MTSSLSTPHPTYPTINPNPHWIWVRKNKYKCSACERETEVDTLYDEVMYKYCPYCGEKLW